MERRRTEEYNEFHLFVINLMRDVGIAMIGGMFVVLYFQKGIDTIVWYLASFLAVLLIAPKYLYLTSISRKVKAK